MLEKELETYLYSQGADLVGFCKIEESPIENQPLLKYAVSIACKLTDSVLRTIENRPSISYFRQYRTVNAELDRLSYVCSRFIEKAGYNAFAVASSQSKPTDKYSGVFQHKTAARLSGLGFIGKSGLFISTKYGSKIRLVTVLTDMPLESKLEKVENLCGSCDICVKKCPAGAISGLPYKEGMKREDFFSAEKCSENMKKYNDIGRGAVCGICIKNCPYNRL